MFAQSFDMVKPEVLMNAGPAQVAIHQQDGFIDVLGHVHGQVGSNEGFAVPRDRTGDQNGSGRGV